ncbi:MAG: c-type cytochrome domain-containing protein, partial [Planctomycetota bacterium]
MKRVPLTTLFLFVSLTAQAADGAEGERLFARRVFPLLKSKCLPCHGGDERKIRGELDLRSLVSSRKGGESGKPALVPGKPKESTLYLAVTYEDPDLE